jgi:hypothetical protein
VKNKPDFNKIVTKVRYKAVFEEVFGKPGCAGNGDERQEIATFFKKDFTCCFWGVIFKQLRHVVLLSLLCRRGTHILIVI